MLLSRVSLYNYHVLHSLRVSIVKRFEMQNYAMQKQFYKFPLLLLLLLLGIIIIIIIHSITTKKEWFTKT